MEIPIQGRPAIKCNICAKTFENRKSQIRHVSYCRKARTRTTSRKKACTACTKAKTRCDMSYPECSRCLAKNIACVYSLLAPFERSHKQADGQSGVADIHASSRPDKDSQNTEERVAANHLHSSIQLISSADSFSPIQNSTATEYYASADSVDSSIWNFKLKDTISTDLFANPEEITLTKPFEYLDKWSFHLNSLEPASSQSILAECPRLSNPLTQTELNMAIGSSGIEFMSDLDFDQLIPRPPKAFHPRRVPGVQFSLNRSYVLTTLRSYPSMMLPNRNLPPFIHPYYRNSGSQYENKSSGKTPLDICAAIMQMYSVKTKETTVFIWRTIKMEQERLLAESSRFSDRDAVAALQAITIYFLLRISEDNDEATNFDTALIYTMIKLAVNMNCFIVNYDNPFGGGMPTWEDWIQAESLRRTMILLFIIDYLFDISSPVESIRCDGSQLLSLSLPSGRDLWRASSRAEWEREFVAQRHGRKNLTYGDLMMFQWKKEGTFDQWLGQLDEFGTLVMAAASLPHVWIPGLSYILSYFPLTTECLK